ncbi:hypothetical protein EVAR_34608_1 [Eumeta japonica]|uniref:Uncharacterized protein n=1 Tax=Eumeta variegata TaxID=151549 RepID=A0A4C1VG29_EUMVA|nr:hypothetical protein EVAR_34608_1 [Eumeta japonica]
MGTQRLKWIGYALPLSRDRYFTFIKYRREITSPSTMLCPESEYSSGGSRTIHRRLVRPPDVLSLPKRPATHRPLLWGCECSRAVATTLLSGGSNTRLLHKNIV